MWVLCPDVAFFTLSLCPDVSLYYVGFVFLFGRSFSWHCVLKGAYLILALCPDVTYFLLYWCHNGFVSLCDLLYSGFVS